MRATDIYSCDNVVCRRISTILKSSYSLNESLESFSVYIPRAIDRQLRRCPVGSNMRSKKIKIHEISVVAKQGNPTYLQRSLQVLEAEI